MRSWAACLGCIALAGCGEAVPARPSVFIAFGRDFDAYQSWTRIARLDEPIPPAHEGRRSAVYLNRRPAASATEFAIGTMLVRMEQTGDDPTRWEVHAMAKRGGGFNANGARGWEFFGLRLDADRHTFVEWRGEGPGNASDGYHLDDGGMILGCNHCHATAVDNDSVLCADLDLAAR